MPYCISYTIIVDDRRQPRLVDFRRVGYVRYEKLREGQSPLSFQDMLQDTYCSCGDLYQMIHVQGSSKREGCSSYVAVSAENAACAMYICYPSLAVG